MAKKQKKAVHKLDQHVPTIYGLIAILVILSIMLLVIMSRSGGNAPIY